MKSQSIKKNFFFQIAYQIIVLVLPLVLSPILTRRLGDTALGNYSYIMSIAYYFVIFAMLGINKYGQRIISSVRDNQEELRKNFWSLLLVHIIVSVISLIAYCLFVLIFIKENCDIYWLFSLYIISALFDLTWLFYGLENFKNVVIKNLFIRILVFVLIVVLVKSSEDLWIYTLLEMGALVLGNILIIPSGIKNVPFQKFEISYCIKHLKPLFVLFVSVVAATLYTVFDKTLIGLLDKTESVAYYEYSNKIINIPKTFITVISTVLFPRACALALKQDYQGQKKYAAYAYFSTFLIAFASIFGLCGISNLFSYIYFGESFLECGNIIICLSPLILIIGLGDIIRNIYLIPQKRDFIYVVCICINAGINILLSIILIPHLGVYGAIIGTTSAELFGLLFQTFLCRKSIYFKDLFKPFFAFLFAGITMYLSIIFIDNFLQPNIISLIIEIIAGGIIYLVITFLITRFWFEDFWNDFLRILFKKHFNKEKIDNIEEKRDN